MKEQLQLLGEKIIKKRYEIAAEVHRDRLAGVNLTEIQKNEFKQIEGKIMEIRADFVALFGQALIDHEDRQKAEASIQKWGESYGGFFFNLGAPLNEALQDTSYYREYFWKVIQEEATAKNMPAATVFEVGAVINPLLDKAVYYFSLTYVNHYQQSLEKAKNAFLEVSIPVIPLMEGVGLLPLIGNIDSERAILLMEKALYQATRLQLDRLILDLSGVLTVDTMVADQLLKLIDALSLIGVNTMVTGIRPEVSQTIISLGIRLNHLTVKSNLHQAFREVQNLQN